MLVIANYEVGSKIRNTSEELPTPKKSLRQLEKENNKLNKK